MRRKKNLPTAQGTSFDVPWAFFHCFPLLGGIAILSFCSSTHSHPGKQLLAAVVLGAEVVVVLVPVPSLVLSPFPCRCPRLFAIVVPIPSPLSCPVVSPLPCRLAPAIHPASSCSRPWFGCCFSIISSPCRVVVLSRVIVVVLVVVVVVVVVIVVLVVVVMVVPVSHPCPCSYAPHFHPTSSGSRWWFWVLLWVVVMAVIVVKTYQ